MFFLWGKLQWDTETLHSLIWSSSLSGCPGVPVEAWVGMVTATLLKKQHVRIGLILKTHSWSFLLHFSNYNNIMNNSASFPHRSVVCHNIDLIYLLTCLFILERGHGVELLWVLPLFLCCNLHVALFLLTVAVDGSLRVDWSAASSLSDLALLGSTRTCLARRLILTAPLGALDFSEVPLTLFFFF